MTAGDEAPAFSGKGYPLNGERLGPAWRSLWAQMSDGKVHAQADLIKSVSEQVGGKASVLLLYKATELGFLEKTTEIKTRGKNRRRTYFQRVDVKSA